ncbi:hypothetical protein [Frondihabitans cladoniiphilus]|uniref:Uncharacterized protein n=1 Tax=Frondihabitans cladoniiphilus TaxID=715785 RepID=A0ABP8VZ36_9MICO
MSDEATGKVPVGFWRHVPWVFVAGLVVSGVLTGVVASYYGTYGGAVLVLWGSVISAGFVESKKLERKRIAEGDPRPARRPSTNAAEIALTAALVLFCGALVVLVSYINTDGDGRVPTAVEGVIAGSAILVSAVVVLLVVLWARRRNRLGGGAAE